jgi:excisionase family DNA binding protein
MLGFRGHFSTKSRAYSIILGSLRADRATHQREYAIAAGLQPDLDSETTLVVTDWHHAGRGHPLIDLLAPTGGVPCPRLLMTVPEAAEALAISRSKLYELLASGAIASVRIDGSRRIPLTALEEYVSRLLTERAAA